MKIVDFAAAHVPEAEALALAAYEEERLAVPILPEKAASLDLACFAENRLGAAAFEDGRMVGFLCAGEPFENAFHSTGARGVFSPMGASAAAGEARERVYAALYQHAAHKWVKAGAVSHGICLYAHDQAAQRQFYYCGFGLRTMDAIRLAEPLGCPAPGGWEYRELLPEEFSLAYPLNQEMYRSFRRSPFFMARVPPRDCGEFCRELAGGGERCFAARSGGRICAYLSLGVSGETFVSTGPGYLHVSGACCAEEFRGSGVFAGLLDHVLRVMAAEGFARLGTDFESINPAARGFWQKHFSVYTHGVVRRIDEGILGWAL